MSSVKLHEVYLVEILQQIRIELAKQQVSQAELCRRMGKGKAYVNNLLRRRHGMTFGKLFELLQALELAPAEFFDALNCRLGEDEREPAWLRMEEMVAEVGEMTEMLRDVLEQLVRSGVLTRDEVDAVNAQAKRTTAAWDAWERDDEDVLPS